MIRFLKKDKFFRSVFIRCTIETLQSCFKSFHRTISQGSTNASPKDSLNLPRSGRASQLKFISKQIFDRCQYFGANVAFFTLHNTSDHFFCHRQPPTHIGAFMHNFYFLAINNKYLYPFTSKSNFVSMKDERCKFNKLEAILALLYPYDEIFTSTRYDSLELIERVSSIKPMRESNTPLCRCSCKERIVLHFPFSVHSRRKLWLSQSKDLRGWSDRPSLDGRRCRLPKVNS